MNDAGLYLFSNIIAKTANDVTLDTFCNIFDTINHIQMVRVPIFPNPTVTATLTCAPWNGTIGGILAFGTPTTLTLNANIDVSENGFRGGALQGATFNCGSNDFFSAFPGPNGQKGEGIAEYILGQEGGGGKLVNGGGAAYAGNAGAGGGSNAGTGGRGGDQYSGCNPTTKFGIGGLGILPQTHTMFLGGGGGGPQADNAQTVFPGGNGGGLIFIAANTIIGNGNSILANGGDVTLVTNDEGASAGGAGGSIYLMAANYNTPLTVSANGGIGGSNNNTLFTSQCHGPGGGGGLIWFSNGGVPGGVTTAINGGASGLVLNPSSTCFNTSHSAVAGANGIINFNFVPAMATIINVDLGPDLPLCSGQTLTLDAGAGYASYLWDDNSMNQTRSVMNVGTYHVTVLNQIGCLGTDTINVFADTSVQADFSFDLLLGCDVDTVIFTNNSVGATSYSWIFGNGSFSNQTNPTTFYAVQGVYTIRLIAGDPPCFDTSFATINTNHPIQATFSATPPDSLCLENNQIILDASFSLPALNATYYWDFGDGNNLTTTSPLTTYSYQTAGTFTITLGVSDTIGCSDTTTRSIIVQDIPAISFTISDDTICAGEVVYFTDSISANANTWLWDFGDGGLLANTPNPAHTYEQSGVFNVTLTGSNPFCPDQVRDTIITVNDYPLINLGEDVTFCPGINESVTLENEANSSAILNWSNGETAASITVNSAGYYWAQSSNQGCATVDSIWVKRDCYLNIPNSFTPGSDGLNDYFIPRELLSSGVTEFSMKIFNRWGEMIFETDKIDGRGWDGKYGGKNQPLGAYVYLIEAKWRNGFKNIFQGNVTLLRFFKI